MKLTTIVAAAFAAGCLSAALPAVAAMTEPDALPATITVTGQGQISRAPDLAMVAVTMVTSDENAGHALSENNRRYNALVAKLAANGISGSDISSTSVQSYYNARPTGPNASTGGQIFGFIVTRNAQINVANLSQTGAVVDAATAAGAAQINGVSYGFRDRRAIERAALAAAVTDARAQADALATAAHVQIVRVLRIENGVGSGRVVPLAMSMARTAEAPVPTQISPSDLDVTGSVTVTYAIR